MTFPQEQTYILESSIAKGYDTQTVKAILDAHGYEMSSEQIWSFRKRLKKMTPKRLITAAENTPNEHLDMLLSLKRARAKIWEKLDTESSGRTIAELTKALIMLTAMQTQMEGATQSIAQKVMTDKRELEVLR